MADADVLQQLAPTGKLRAAINLGNSVLAQTDAATGEPKGITPDLARELGRRLGVGVDLVSYDAAGKVFDAAQHGSVGCRLCRDRAGARRRNRLAPAPYVMHRGHLSRARRFAAAARSRTSTVAGVRVAVGHEVGLRPLPHAHARSAPTLVRAAAGGAQGHDRLSSVNDKLEAAGRGEAAALQLAKDPSRSVRVMDGRFMDIRAGRWARPRAGSAGARLPCAPSSRR